MGLIWDQSKERMDFPPRQIKSENDCKNKQYYIIKCNTCLPNPRRNYCGKRSFAYRAASEYNELLYDLRQTSSFTAFKSKLNNR